MLRGTLVLWAGLLTILVLHRRLHIHNWFGMVLIVAGAAIVGASRFVAAMLSFWHILHNNMLLVCSLCSSPD